MIIKQLEIFIGKWEMEISQASFLSDPSETLKGHASIEWYDSGNFMIIRQGAQQSGPPFSTWIIGCDDSTDICHMLYNDSRGVSRIYKMTFHKGIWQVWREAPGFSQRFAGEFSKEGNIITARWEKSIDGKNWEHDFNLTYNKKY